MMFPHVLAVGYLETMVYPRDGQGLNLIGGSNGMAVVNFRTSLKENLNSVDLILTNPWDPKV